MSRPTGALRTAAAGLLFAAPLVISMVGMPPAEAPMLAPLGAALLAGAGVALLALGQRGTPWVRWIRVVELSLASLAGALASLIFAAVVLHLVSATGLGMVGAAVTVYALVGLAGLALPTLVFAAVRAFWPGDLTA